MGLKDDFLPLYFFDFSLQRPLLLLKEIANGFKVVEFVFEGPLALVILEDVVDFIDAGFWNAVLG